MLNNLDNLLKSTSCLSQKNTNNKSFTYSKRALNGICRSLSIESKNYEPSKTVDSIKHYIGSKDHLDRILYSEISSYIFSLDSSDRGVFITNAENLLMYSLDGSRSLSLDCKKIIIKIYDHSQLAFYQIDNAASIFATSIEDAKNSLNSELKNSEKEYIAILGIFAAVILTFVSGITFTSSILQNIASASIYRTVLVCSILGLILINSIYILFNFIDQVARKKGEKPIKPVVCINIFLIVIIVATTISWNRGVVENRNKRIYHKEQTEQNQD